MTELEIKTDYSTHRSLVKTDALRLPWPEGELVSGGLKHSGFGKEDHDLLPLITIITVVRNNAKQIGETIESVIHQSYANIEFIIADGASNDGTVEVIRKYEHCIDLWYSRPDRGIYDAMNTALSLASGRYVHFLNSDDHYPHYRTLEIVMDEFRKNQARWIHGNVLMMDKSKGRAWIRYSNVNRFYYLFKGIPQQAFIFEKKLYDEFGNFSLDYPIVADLDFLLKIMLKYKIPGKYMNMLMVIFDTKGISGNMERKRGERELVLKKYFPRWAFILLKNKLFKRLLARNEVKNRKKSFIEKYF